MKANLVLAVLLIFFNHRSNSQNCHDYPTHEQLISSLSNGLNPRYSLNQFNPDCNVDYSIKQKIISLLDNQWDSLRAPQLANKYFFENFEFAHFNEIISVSNDKAASEAKKNGRQIDFIKRIKTEIRPFLYRAIIEEFGIRSIKRPMLISNPSLRKNILKNSKIQKWMI